MGLQSLLPLLSPVKVRVNLAIVITMAIFLESSQAENFTNTNDMTALQALYQRKSFFLCT